MAKAVRAQKWVGKKAADKNDEKEDHDAILKMTAALGEKEAAHFADIAKHAAQELEVADARKREKAAARAKIAEAESIARNTAAEQSLQAVHKPQDEAAAPEEKEKRTMSNPPVSKVRAPRQFVDLLPADVDYLYFYWLPEKKTVWAQFKGRPAQFNIGFGTACPFELKRFATPLNSKPFP